MYLGRLNDPGSYVTGTGRFFRRGVLVPLLPDLDGAPVAASHPFPASSLYQGGAKQGWKWTTVLDVGIDFDLALKAPCFLDRVVLTQGAGSAVACVEVLVEGEDGRLSPAGILKAGEGGTLEDSRLVVPLGVPVRHLVIRLHTLFKNLVVEQVELFGASGPEFTAPKSDPSSLDSILQKGIPVYPPPASMKIGKGIALQTRALREIHVSTEASDDTLFAAKLFSEKLLTETGLRVPVRTGGSPGKTKDALILGKRGELAALDAKAAPGVAEGYALIAEKGAVWLSAVDRRGLVYGVEALLSMLRRGPVPACTIEDRPRMAWRGVHFGLPPKEEIPFVKRLIRHLLVPMRYNTIFLEIAAGMRFDSHPEINEKWIEANEKAARGEWPPVPHGNMIAGGSCLTKAEVRDLVAYARGYGIEVIPEVQSLSHVQFLTMTYPEIAEVAAVEKDEGAVDLHKADAKPPEKYPHCYCPSHEKSYEIIQDLIDEIVEVVRPERYVHMGHDEVYVIGVCPRCLGKDPADLFALHVNRIHGYLAKKGLGMMIWADMLQPDTAYKTPPAISKITKDIVLLDFIWYFHFGKDLEDNLLPHGFKVISGNMYSSHFPRYESRLVKPGMVGAQVSTWLREDEYTLGFEGKLYDFLYSANMLWSATYRGELRLLWDRVITGFLPGIRERVRGIDFPSLSPGRRCAPITLRGSNSLPEGFPAEILSPGLRDLRGIPFRLGAHRAVIGKKARAAGMANAFTIPLKGRFDSLVFLHACGGNAERIPWQALKRVASYRVEYGDGRKVEIPVEYGGNIGPWNRRHGEPMPQAFYRHQGYLATWLADPFLRAKTAFGGDVCLYGFEWINPRPSVPILKFHLRAEDDSDSAVHLFGVTGIQKVR
jgi:hypothetical protein